jgi:hypothetical protein
VSIEFNWTPPPHLTLTQDMVATFAAAEVATFAAAEVVAFAAAEVVE